MQTSDPLRRRLDEDLADLRRLAALDTDDGEDDATDELIRELVASLTPGPMRDRLKYYIQVAHLALALYHSGVALRDASALERLAELEDPR
jgi:hypothetical protein